MHTQQIMHCKRLFDILFSALVLLCTAPLFILIILAIKSTSRGDAFYTCNRIGKEGKIIRCFKFRTMHQNADQKLKELLLKNPTLKKEWSQYFKLKNDPRITKVGKFLRKTSLDEFPQFWNVLKGDLSVVGPRALTEEEVNRYGNLKQKLLSIRPGITCIWQTSGRNLLTFNQRIELDQKYLENNSLLFDLRLIGKTVVTVFFPKGAY